MQKRNEILKEATKMFAAEKDVTEQEAASMVNFKGFSGDFRDVFTFITLISWSWADE